MIAPKALFGSNLELLVSKLSIFIPGKYSRFRFFENHIVENGWFELKLGRGDLHVFSFVTQLGGTDTSHYFSFFRRISVEVKG